MVQCLAWVTYYYIKIYKFNSKVNSKVNNLKREQMVLNKHKYCFSLSSILKTSYNDIYENNSKVG